MTLNRGVLRGSQLQSNTVLVYSKKHDEERFPKVSAFYASKIPTLQTYWRVNVFIIKVLKR